MPDLDRYAWTKQNYGICLAVVDGVTEDELIDRYGGDPSTAGPATFDQAMEPAGRGAAVLFVRTVLAVEDNGWQGTRPASIYPGAPRPAPRCWPPCATPEVPRAQPVPVWRSIPGDARSGLIRTMRSSLAVKGS